MIDMGKYTYVSDLFTVYSLHPCQYSSAKKVNQARVKELVYSGLVLPFSEGNADFTGMADSPHWCCGPKIGNGFFGFGPLELSSAYRGRLEGQLAKRWRRETQETITRNNAKQGRELAGAIAAPFCILFGCFQDTASLVHDYRALG
eukprot:Gb_13894 [translate_table: standard]